MSNNLGVLILILGPSGTGKGTTIDLLQKRHPEWVFPPSVTTRLPRPGENEGAVYNFVSLEEFEKKKSIGEFLEWACVHESDYYGTLRSEILPPLEEGKIVIREVDAQGFLSIIENSEIPRKNVIGIFLFPSSSEELINRITKRAPISPLELSRRMESLQREIEIASACDFQIQTEEGELALPANEIEQIIKLKTR